MFMRTRHSVVVKAVALFLCVIVLLSGTVIYCNSFFLSTIRQRVADSYTDMAKYYAHDIDNRLGMILEQMVSIGEMVPFSNIAYSNQTEQDQYELSKHELVNELSSKIAYYRPLDYFFVFKSSRDTMLWVPSAALSYTVEHNKISAEMAWLLKGRIREGNVYNNTWKLIMLAGQEYLYRTLLYNDTYLGACIKVKRLLELLGGYRLSDFSVTFLDGDGELPPGSQDETIISVPSQRGDYQVVLVTKYSTMYQDLRGLNSLSYFVVLCLLLLIGAFALLLNGLIIRPIRKIVFVMEQIKTGRIDVRMPNMKKQGEFQLIASTFNQMIDRQQQLIYNNYQKEIAQEKLKAQCYRLQINPHFFLNALNTLFLLNKRQDTETAQMILHYLIRYFRSAFSDREDMIPLGQEIDQSLDYAAVQRFRYSGGIHMSCDVSTEASETLVPFMFLLTFVENAIKYAGDSGNDVDIHVKAWVERDTLHLTVDDNGSGFTEDDLRTIRTVEPILKEGREHIGIFNIMSRLKLYYGADFQAVFENKEDGGAMVCLSIPARKERDELEATDR